MRIQASAHDPQFYRTMEALHQAQAWRVTFGLAAMAMGGMGLIGVAWMISKANPHGPSEALQVMIALWRRSLVADPIGLLVLGLPIGVTLMVYLYSVWRCRVLEARLCQQAQESNDEPLTLERRED